MPSPRPLRSGIDFQLRYAIARTVSIAAGDDPLSERAARVRVEWPFEDPSGGEVWTDVVIEAAGGEILEIVECKEHEGHLAEESIASFVRDAGRLHGSASVSPSTRFRFFSTARFLPDGRDLANETVRRALLDRLGADPERPFSWELGADSKQALSAYTVLLLTERVGDAKSVYTNLYARFAGQMSHRAPGSGRFYLEGIRDLHLELFRAIEDDWLAADLRLAPEDVFEIDALRRTFRPWRVGAVAIAKEKIEYAIHRNLFGEKVTLGQIFIEPEATYEKPVAGRTLLYPGNKALAALFDWLADVRQRERGGGPLLVIGSFGSGKSSLLTTFAARLLQAGSGIVPLLVPLRELVALGPQKSFADVLHAYIRREWNVDLLDADAGDSSVRYCLLCDGFDELNLYYARSDQRAWVEQVFRELVDLSQYRHLAVAVSSRPILLLDLTRPNFPGALSPRLTLHDFTPPQVAEWCDRYRGAARLQADFSAEFLASRNLLEIARTPIILYMLARIIEDEPAAFTQKRYTRADVFRIFVDWTVRKGGYEHDALKHRVPPSYRRMLQDAAWDLAQADSGFLEEQELLGHLRRTYGEEVDGVAVDRNLLVAHMFHPLGSSLASGDTGRLIEFRHQSFRDYLVAERIWRILESVRGGAPIEPRDWLLLSGRPVTPATFQFLDEMMQDASDAELRGIYGGLLRADQMHLYWTVWTAPVWEQLARDLQHAPALAVETARAHVHTLAPQACAQAVLAFLLRGKARHRLESRGQVEGIEPLSGETLTRILAFLTTFPETGIAGQARSLLLGSLDGLRLPAGADFRQVTLSGASLDDASLEHADFTAATLEGVSLERAQLRNAVFTRAAFVPRRGDHLVLSGCLFEAAEITLGTTGAVLRDVDLTGVMFDHATVALHLIEAKLTGCTWQGTHLRTARLERCLLDAHSWGFLLKHGARFIDCRLDATPGWGSRRVFKDLAAGLRTSTDRAFERAALPYLRLIHGDVRQSSPRGKRDAAGVDLYVGGDEESPFELVVQCKSSVERNALPEHLARCRQSIRAFRDSGLHTRTYILLFNREVDTVAHRDALHAELAALADAGSAREVFLWSHHDLLNAAFNVMHGRVVQWLRGWNQRLIEEHHAVEKTIGSKPLTQVPYGVRILRVDAAHQRSEEPGYHTVGEPLRDVLEERKRRIRVLIGQAGMGKTTTVMHAVGKKATRWIFIPAAAVRGDVANAHALFETALDQDAVLEGAGDEDRALWQRMIGPVLKKLTQSDSGFGIIVDALDESPALETSFGLQRFFTLFRRAVVPVIVTARTEFWDSRRSDFENEITGIPERESTVQTIEVVELEPWSNSQIVSAAETHLETLGEGTGADRLRQFLETVRSGAYERFYGDLPRTPLFLRFILDLLEHEDPRDLPRATVMLRWARLKVLRDFRAPMRHGGRRIPMQHRVKTADDAVEFSFRAMAAAAAAMTRIEGRALHLVADCRFDDIRIRLDGDAPDRVDALLLNSLLVPSVARADDGTQRVRFAHRLFQELFLARWISDRRHEYSSVQLPAEIEAWLQRLEEANPHLRPAGS